MKNDSIRASIPKISPLVIAPAFDPVIPGMKADMMSQIPTKRTVQPIALFFEIAVDPVIKNTIPTIRKSVMFATFEPTIPGIKDAMTSQIAKIRVSQPCQLMIAPPQIDCFFFLVMFTSIQHDPVK